MEREFGDDPMDKFSRFEVKESELGMLLCLSERRNSDKPGRSLRVMFDRRMPLTEDFECEYVYCVIFDQANSWAGNHYHREKHEIVYCMHGSCEVMLRRASGTAGEIETHTLSANAHNGIYIWLGVVHKVTAKSDGAVILVIANSPNTLEDEFYCDV